VIALDKIKAVFDKNYGYASAQVIKESGVPYHCVQKHLKEGTIERIRRGFYRWHSVDELNEAATIAGLFPDAILCMDSVLFHWGYSDRIPFCWHLAVDKDSSKMRFDLPYPPVQPYYLEPHILSLGAIKGQVNDVEMNIYDRERAICDCLRNFNKMDRETFNKAIQGYIAEPRKNISNLITYSKKLRVFKKVQTVIGVWL